MKPLRIQRGFTLTYASKTINRKTAAIFAALFMVCTAFVVFADNSEAAAYNDAKAFEDMFNPHAADAPGAFDLEWSGSVDLEESYEGKTILLESGTTLNVGTLDFIQFSNCKIYVELGGDHIRTSDATAIMISKDCQVVFGYSEGTTNGFTVDLPADVSVMSEFDIQVTQGSVSAQGMMAFGIWDNILVVSANKDPVQFNYSGDNWDLFIPMLIIQKASETTPAATLAALSMNKTGYTCKYLSGTNTQILVAGLLNPKRAGMQPGPGAVVIDGAVDKDTEYTGEIILVKPGFNPAAGITVTLTDCVVFFAPGTYEWSDAFKLKMGGADSSIIFGDATPNTMAFSQANLTFDIPATKLTVTEDGFTAGLNGDMTVTSSGSETPLDSLVVKGTGSEDMVFKCTEDYYDWEFAVKSFGNGTSVQSYSIVCADGKLSDKRAIEYDGTDGKVEVTADMINNIKTMSSQDPTMEVSFKIDDKYTVVLNQAAIQSLSGAATLEVKDTTADQSALTDKQKEAIGDRPVFSISFGDNTNFGTGTVTVTVPYALKNGESPNGIYVAYVAADGTLEKLPTTYNAEDGTVTFTTTHFSVFTVMAGLTHGNISPAVMAAAALTAAVVGALVAIVIRSGRY